MGEKAVAKIKASLAFAKQSTGRLWLGRAHAVAGEFVARLAAHPAVAQVSEAGSLRRGRDTVGDIDILAALRRGHEHEAGAVGELFRTTPGVSEVLAAGESKSSVRVSLAHNLGRWKPQADGDGAGDGPSVQVDLRVMPPDRWGSGLLYFTGSKDHNIRLRERAQARGMTLNEWGLFQDDGGKEPPQARGLEPLAAGTEEAIYERLGLPWIPPEVREDRGELEHRGPWRLVEVEDIRAELHAHTTASDGLLSIDELAQEAKRRGFHSIAVTDHSQSSAQANGLKPDRLRRHVEAVREAGARIKGITILAGSEVDIHADGRLDYEDDLLAELDIVVASPHSALTQEPKAATERLVRAVSHPLVHILGHPTGRLINRRPGMSPDMERIAAAAKAHGTALEVNAHWMRLDLRDVHVRVAVEAGCDVAINCDVHVREDYDNLPFGVATARRGWLTPARCVNTWSAKTLAAWLKKKR
jgi:DNA polymerase (family 10)